MLSRHTWLYSEPDPLEGSGMVGPDNGQNWTLTLLSEHVSCLKHGVVDLPC